MRTWFALCLVGALAGSAGAATITTTHYATEAARDAVVVSGFEFVGHGDSAKIALARTAPPSSAERPFSIWNAGVPHAFKVVYSPSGIAGISIDDLYSLQTSVSIDPATNGLALTAFSTADCSVLLDNLKLTLPGFVIHNVDAVIGAPASDYALVSTDLPLSNGFILSGRVTLDWTGSAPPAAAQWFEAAPVVTPEPTAALLLLTLPLIRRRRGA
jgi:hypothetical protein